MNRPYPTRRWLACALGAALAVAAAWVQARGTYQEPDAFIAEVFAPQPPPVRLLWITPPMQADIERILGHPLGVLRVRYWCRGTRSAWILEEIGKEQPITTGIVVDDGRIERVKILIFRESRGWEVRYPFFTDQFGGAGLDGDLELDRHIDGVTGATLSVRAVTRLSRLALYLSRYSECAREPPA